MANDQGWKRLKEDELDLHKCANCGHGLKWHNLRVLPGWYYMESCTHTNFIQKGDRQSLSSTEECNCDEYREDV